MGRIKLTDDGQIDPAVASRWPFEINTTSIKTGIGFTNIVNNQSSCALDCAEISSFAQHVFIGPMSWPVGVLVPSIVPTNQMAIEKHCFQIRYTTYISIIQLSNMIIKMTQPASNTQSDSLDRPAASTRFQIEKRTTNDGGPAAGVSYQRPRAGL